MTTVHQLDSTFAVLTPALSFATETVDKNIYARLDQNYNDFKGHALVSTYMFEKDWGVWEMHPAGDELVMLLDGDVTLVLRQDGADTEVRLTQPSSYVIVPQEIWHTARTNTATRMLFVTPGEGTRNEAFA